MMKNRFLFFGALNVIAVCMVTFQGQVRAATLGTNVRVSMPFSRGDTVSITADCAGPFSSVTEYLSVSDGTKVVFEKTITHGVPVGQGKTRSFSADWNVPSDLQAKRLTIFVVFLEGAEKYVGEPGIKKPLTLIARCSSRRACKYATPRYWISVTRNP